MDPHHDPLGADEPVAIRNRTDSGSGWLNAWPLIALALIGLILVRTCVTSLPVSPPPPASTSTSR